MANQRKSYRFVIEMTSEMEAFLKLAVQNQELPRFQKSTMRTWALGYLLDAAEQELGITYDEFKKEVMNGEQHGPEDDEANP